MLVQLMKPYLTISEFIPMRLICFTFLVLVSPALCLADTANWSRFRGPNGTAGQLAATHSQSFESMYAHIPGLKVITPSNPYDAKGLLKAAIRDNDPVVFFESEKMYGDKGLVPDGEYILPIGVADIKKEGTDVTLVSFGKIMKTALAAAAELEKEGISMEVIDLRTIRPLDIDTIVQSVKKTNRLIILEESWPVASISTEIAYRVQRHAFDFLDAPIRRLTQSDTPFAFATTLIDAALPQIEDVVRTAKEVLYR
jgi:pyruvate dehydrogenase E1 component beta subunit